MEGTVVKDRIVTDLTLQLGIFLKTCEIGSEAYRLKKLENIIISSLRDVEVLERETALSTERDNNDYIISVLIMDYRKRERSERTIEQYSYAIRDLIDYIDKDIRKITTADVRLYLDHYGQGVQATTYNNQMRNLSAVFTWLRRHRVIDYNPVELIEPKKEIQKPVDFLSDVELMHVREACKSIRDRALVEFLLSTGVRVGELIRIQIGQIDWREGIVRNVFARKSSNYRDVFLTPVAAHLLKKYLDSRDDNVPYLFVSAKKPNNQLTERGVDDIMRRLTKRTGLDRRLYPHLFRHTMATMAHERGAQLDDIQRLLGHASPATTAKYYTAVTTSYLKHVHERFCSGW